MNNSAFRRQSANGSLTILEAETGAGKTDAAFGHFKSLKERGLCDSCYFALPTRTSAAQIYGRTKIAVERFLDPAPPVILAVPGYMTNQPTDAAILPDIAEHDNLSSWHIENSNRYLSSVVAVGTIDQALYSITGSKHSTMRWASFSRSLLIVDEVHASDAYMSLLLEAIIKRHIKRGGHVLLMSATLGSVAGGRFISKAGVKRHRTLNLADAKAVPYPAAHVVQNGQLSVIPLTNTGNSKSVDLKIEALMDDPRAVAELAAAHIKNGAKVLIIRNTVKACVDVQKAIEALVPTDCLMNVRGIAVPHHGRYAAEDRLDIDKAIEEAFGKGSPRKAVVAVGTQTIEQSLDIDADIIITDACPMDVLLQRLGRLHRHLKNARPAGYEVPTAIVLTPIEGFDQYMKKAGNGFGKDRAYENVFHVIAAVNEIKKRGRFNIPEENRELVEITTHPEAIEHLVGNNEEFRKHFNQAEGSRTGQRSIGAQAVRSEEWRYGDSLGANWEGSPTRLGDPGIRVEFASAAETFLGNSIDGATIPYWMIKGYEKILDQRKTTVVSLFSELEFQIGSKDFSYSRFGLETVSDKNRST
jgi:CRISPR-associated endonuclease/helicase Cas3